MIAARLKSSFGKYFDAPVEAWRQFGSNTTPEGRRNGLVFNLLVGVNWY